MYIYTGKLKKRFRKHAPECLLNQHRMLSQLNGAHMRNPTFKLHTSQEPKKKKHIIKCNQIYLNTSFNWLKGNFKLDGFFFYWSLARILGIKETHFNNQRIENIHRRKRWWSFGAKVCNFKWNKVNLCVKEIKLSQTILFSI